MIAPSRALLVATTATLLTGCLGTGKPRPASVKERVFEPDRSGNTVYMEKVPTTTRSVVTKNYAVGARRVATVGEPMVGVRNYMAADRVVSGVALQDFRQLCRKPGKDDAQELDKLACRSGRLALLRGSARDRFEVDGSFSEAGKTYYMVELPGSGGSLYLAVDTSGRVKPGRYVAWAPEDVDETPAGVPMRWQDPPVPLQVQGPLFRFETAETIVPESANFVHYELLYKGTSYDRRGMVYHILYREYRRENASLPLYEQDLEFSGSVGTIDVLGLRLRVHDVSNTQIVYTVISD